jgi:alpha-glucosidase
MGELKWWQKTIVYQIYPKSFCDSNDDGIGDIVGIISKLDYLHDLGVGAIWLCPIYPSPLVDNGYDISDYCAIAPEYGTMEDMEKLISEADKRNIKIVMDLVFNHTSDKHKWFEEARSSKDNPKRDWYIWRDGKDDKSAPTNWRGIFGGSAWTFDETTGQYYLHTFTQAQPDLNWENPEVRKALYDVCRFWLDKGISGFRIDAIVYIKKPAVFEDLPVDGPDGLGNIAKADGCQDGILDFLHEWKDEIFAKYPNVFTVAETDGVKPADYSKWIGENGVFDMSFDFSHIRLGFEDSYIWYKRNPWKLIDIRKCFTAAQEATKDSGWVPVFFENHDLPRCVNYFFPKGTDTDLAAKFIGTILLTMRGTPFIYQAQELGMTNIKWPSIKMYNDISSIGQYDLAIKEGLSPKEAMQGVWKYSRDNARSPMTWNNGSHAGFSKGKPWLPLNDEYGKINVESELQDENSVLNYYKELIKLRNEHKALYDGDYEELLSYSPGIYAYARTAQDKSERIIVIMNTTAKIRGYKVPEIKGAQLLISNYGNREKTLLRSYEIRVYKVKQQ